MKSDTDSVLEQPSAPREKRAINPWMLVVGAVVGGAVLIVVVLVAVAWLSPRRPLTENERRMPDGTVLKIEAVTSGTVHWCEFEGSSSEPWAFWDRRTDTVRDAASGPTTFENSLELKIWMARRAERSSQLLPLDWWGSSSVVNSLGVEVADFNPRHLHIEPTRVFMVDDKRPFATTRREGEQWLVNSSFPAFRTDSGKFRLRVKNTSGDVVAEFDLNHPSPPPFKDWHADVLPVTKTVEGLAVTLQRFQRLSETDRTDRFRPLLKLLGLEAVITENGLATQDWEFSCRLDDPFGHDVQFGPKDFTGEPAWRLQLGARRQSDAEFPASETWVLADVPLPSKDSVQFRSDTHTLDGVTFKLALIAGPGHVKYSIPAEPIAQPDNNLAQILTIPVFETPASVKRDRDESTMKIDAEVDFPHVTFEITRQSFGGTALMKARNSQGENVATQQYFIDGRWSYFLKTEPDAKSITLLFIVSRGREFEFFVKPPETSEKKPLP